ncbi:hypothetical protein Phum_PHUM019020 [Pediculus humanus corporis]|uniref:Uncharacterized protein n=1 Tax=Pediculus humanus subsp. corporis TaxID=121224 RepID=E0V9P5_PEDHC|nr:uncharacterized protein Phum_PHUM019020 [Pediculus humanus corporis]EEB10114.1 hypothetical protein Phum_PHUM019020 [Pediculus humanus corporis]
MQRNNRVDNDNRKRDNCLAVRVTARNAHNTFIGSNRLKPTLNSSVKKGVARI